MVIKVKRMANNAILYVHYLRQQVDDATRKIIDYICQ